MSSALPYNLQWASDDLDKAIAKNDIQGTRSALQDILNQLSLGVDVSPLLNVVIQSAGIDDIPCRRQVYTIMTSIASHDAETTILITNTLLKDCANTHPIIRGMALRAICDIPISEMKDKLGNIIAVGLSDTNSYVKRMAVLATVHLFHVQPESVQEKGLVNRLYDLLRDRDPQIICNSLFALSDILKDEGGIALDMRLIHHLVNSLPRFSEWAQSEVLMVLSNYIPQNDKERFDIMNIVDPYLSSASSAVLCSATKVLFSLTNDKMELQKQVIQRVIPKFITHLASSSPEVSYTIIKHLVVMAKRFPDCFRPHVPHFYVQFIDPFYIACSKFELLKIIAYKDVARDIVETTSRYVLLEKPHTTAAGVGLLRDLALKLPAAVEPVYFKFRLFFDMNRRNIINQVLIVLPDLMRRIPQALPDFISLLQTDPSSGLSGPAIASYAWILGEYGDRIQNAVYTLERIMMNFWGNKEATEDVANLLKLPSAHDEQSMMKISIMTALTKLLFIAPGQARPVLASALSAGQKDNHPSVRARANFLFQLLKQDIDAARAALLTSKTSNQEFVEDADSEWVDIIFDEFNTFSVIYDKPESEWNQKPEDINIQLDDDDDDDDDDKLDEIDPDHEITPDMFQEMWESEGICVIEDGISLGYEIELEGLIEALKEANLGIIAEGYTEDEGSKIFAYGYLDGNAVLINATEMEGEMGFTIKAETDEICNAFKEFWLNFFETE